MIVALSILSIFGVSLGSFIGACSYRIPRRIPLMGIPSSCPNCKRRLRWRELIPIGSFVWTNGKCARCSAPISKRYLLTELLAGLVCVGLFLMDGPSGKYVYDLSYVIIMIPIAMIDWE